ncbi:MAG TPA: trehalose-phosphatase [bacterium]|nr:trehalose-phosphatase [bacterium]
MKPSSTSPKLLFLLDYDGTLTDFKRNPEHSKLPPAAKKIVNNLRRKYPVVFISGRYVDSLQRVSGLKHLPMIGTHGFEARHFPKGFKLASAAQERRFKKEAALLWKHLQALYAEFPRIHIEKKPFSSTLHYRGVSMPPQKEKALRRRFEEILRKAVTRRLWGVMEGKKMIEAFPKGFSKGKAVQKLLKAYPGALPIYAGDDLTDITVFKVLGKSGLKIAVGPRIPKHHYDLRFDSPKEFLNWLKNF